MHEAVLFAGALVILVLVTQMGPYALAETQAGALQSIQSAYVATRAAEQLGANVTLLDQNLTAALGLVEGGAAIQSGHPALSQQDYLQADSIATKVESQAQSLGQGTSPLAGRGLLDLGIELGVLIAAAVVIYLLTPRVYWSIWTRINKETTARAP